jgi:hypothetical protein
MGQIKVSLLGRMRACKRAQTLEVEIFLHRANRQPDSSPLIGGVGADSCKPPICPTSSPRLLRFPHTIANLCPVTQLLAPRHYEDGRFG